MINKRKEKSSLTAIVSGGVEGMCGGGGKCTYVHTDVKMYLKCNWH